MKNAWADFLKVFSAIVGAIAGFFGGFSPVMKCLLIFNIVDYATGYICALLGRSPKTESGGASSKVGFIGLARKAFIWLVVLLAILLDRAIGSGNAAFQTAAAFFYISNEGLSIIENAALMGVPIPPFLKKILEVLLEKSGSGDGHPSPKELDSGTDDK